jgi:hypothetical protein
MGVLLQCIFDASLHMGCQDIIATHFLLLLKGKDLVLKDCFLAAQRDIFSHVRHIMSIFERINEG